MFMENLIVIYHFGRALLDCKGITVSYVLIAHVSLASVQI